MSATHGEEVKAGRRFSFGRNWRRYLSVVDETRIKEAERSLCEMLEMSNLEGLTFLDVGSGSGLFSLAARRLGARVHSLDYDPDSVRCAEELRRRYVGDNSSLEITEGSILDATLVDRLPQYDVVYSWGILHHSGNLWEAMEHVLGLVKHGGKLFIAIYNDQGKQSLRWRKVKQVYCSGQLGRLAIVSIFIPAFALKGLIVDLARCRSPLSRYKDYNKKRGMSVYHDWLDWLGG